MRKGEATRTRIVDAATRLAAVRGLTAVSLADVAEAVGLSKSGIFKHFESKEDMHMAVVETVMRRFRDFVFAGVAEMPPGRAPVEAMFDNWLAWGETEWRETGCPVMQLSVELDDQPGVLRDMMQAELRAFREAAVGQVRRLREPPLSEDEAQSTYFQMKSFILGQLDARRMMGDRNTPNTARAAFNVLLDRQGPAAA